MYISLGRASKKTAISVDLRLRITIFQLSMKLGNSENNAGTLNA